MSGANTSNSKNTKTSFKATELCELIKACGEAGVAEFSLGDLRVSFMGQKASGMLTMGQYAPSIEDRSEPSPTTHEVELSQDEELAQKLLADPLAYEEMV